MVQQDNSYFHVEKDKSYSSGMKPWTQPDPVRNLLIEKADGQGETLASLSRKIGKNHAYLQQFVQRGTPRYLPEHLRESLAPLIGVQPDDLRGPFAPSDTPVRLPPSLSMGRPALDQRQAPTVRLTVPLLGQGSAGRDGAFPLNGEKVGDIAAPPSVARIRDAYAIYVVGDSMVPRYEPGEIVFVDTTKPALKGDYVVVQLVDEEGSTTPSEGYIKQYVGRDHRTLKLLQLHPKKSLTFPLSRVLSVHVIVMSGKG